MISSFRWAIRGVIRTVTRERNMRIHLCFTFYVLLAGFVTGISRAEWAAVLLCIGIVTAAELFNTAIEQLADRVTKEKDPLIARCKDAAAGGVLCCAVIAAIVGCIVFFGGGHPRAAWDFACRYPWLAAAFVLLLIPAWLFVRAAEHDRDNTARKERK